MRLGNGCVTADRLPGQRDNTRPTTADKHGHAGGTSGGASGDSVPNLSQCTARLRLDGDAGLLQTCCGPVGASRAGIALGFGIGRESGTKRGCIAAAGTGPCSSMHATRRAAIPLLASWIEFPLPPFASTQQPMVPHRHFLPEKSGGCLRRRRGGRENLGDDLQTFWAWHIRSFVSAGESGRKS